jgi:Asp-tRNA(Asn)/Glu-tRNA(Gln) amidotransferase A subunit family amidase
LRERFHRLMDERGIDAWAMPSATGPAPVGLRSTGDPAMNLPWTHSGLPAMTLPASFVDGAPVGLQLASRAGTDEMLLAWAALIEGLL